MPTPYDGKILLVQVKGQFLARKSIGDVSRMIVDNVPNVDGVFLQTSQGREWQGKFDNDAKEINGPNEISQWVSAMASRGLDTHVWGIPHGLSIQEEAQKFIDAAKTPGVKSLGLDVEHGANYYRGTADAARQMMQLIRDALGWAPAQQGWSAAKSIEDMDRGGVAGAMLSLPHSVHIWPEDRKEGRRLAREWNEFMAQLALDHPGRFGVFAALPILDIEGSLKEIEHAFDALGAHGVALMTNIDCENAQRLMPRWNK